MTTNAVNRIVLDGSSARIRFHLSNLGGIAEINGLEEKKRQEKFTPLGEQYATARSPGIIEISDAELVMTSVGWADFLRVLPDQFGDITFPILANERHVTLSFGYTVLLDECQIIGDKQDFKNDEKIRKVTIPISVMRIVHKGADGQRKTLARRPGVSPLVSPAGQALGF